MPEQKKLFRKLESELWLTEKMLTHALLRGRLTDFPQKELSDAERDILVASFHDTITGTSTMEVEEQTVSQLGHGIEILERLKTRAFFALLSGSPASNPGDFPVWVYNPHPHPIKQVIDCELSLIEWSTEERYTPVEVYQDCRRLPSQVEKHSSNHNIDFRKRIVFEAECPPSSLSYFACRQTEPLKEKPRPAQLTGDEFVFKGTSTSAKICCETGRTTGLTISAIDLIGSEGINALIMKDRNVEEIGDLRV